MQQEDVEFLQLTNQLYFNHPSTFQGKLSFTVILYKINCILVNVPCSSNGYCDYPAQIKCAGVNIGPAYPAVR